jgi:polyphosphate kinase
MIVRREDGGLRRYVHLGTGNYHPSTARLYSDFSLFTCDEHTCADVNQVFNQLTSLGKAGKLHYLWQSPFTLHQRTIEAIRNEARLAREGKPARIIAKMNAVLEPDTIEALYDASQAGVKIDLIVRGVCALRPGIEGLSENIKVRSIVGRFLEHHRVFYFRNDGQEDVYLSSADWMDRNFFRRIELCFPLLDKKLKARVIKEGLNAYLGDNVQAWEMNPDGSYSRKQTGKSRHSVQEELLEQLAHQQLG